MPDPIIRDRKNQDRNFRTLVRLVKKWRNYAEIEALKSFLIELIMAYILDEEEPTDRLSNDSGASYSISLNRN